ncbi:hypothetical protein BWI92_15425 [Flectobacillus sp. BAB-3569]|nr:hypothetical protein BWI92_15425 [Flectobacillus sp. BAB-3569]
MERRNYELWPTSLNRKVARDAPTSISNSCFCLLINWMKYNSKSIVFYFKSLKQWLFLNFVGILVER